MIQLEDKQPNVENGIRIGNLNTFEELFKDYYNYLCFVAFDFVKEKYIAEEIVSDVFFTLWEKRDTIQINSSITAYLIRSVRNRCINYRQHCKSDERFNQAITEKMSQYASYDEYPVRGLLINELSALIVKSIDNLPQQCRQTFLLSRDENMKYEEIAQRLNISINTVKTQMKIALSKLRVSLKDYMVISFFFIMLF
jgi:RNA polymerase sigma-70 factor (ECF subfamily)